MANITVFTPAGTYTRLTVVITPALFAFLAHKGYTVVASSPVN